MKFIDLENIPKYFSMANLPYYKVAHMHGTINRVEGTVINNLTNELQDFSICLDVEDNVRLKVEGIEAILQ
jgi:hypothetical protein